LTLSQYWNLEPIDIYRFNVTDDNFGGIIDLKVKTCTYQVFDFNKLPCGHVLASACSRNIDLYTLFSIYYQTKGLLCAYANSIMPVSSQADWTVPQESASIKLLQWATRRKCKRRRICRIPLADEEKIRVKCGHCRQISHNRQSCLNPITLDEKEGRK